MMQVALVSRFQLVCGEGRRVRLEDLRYNMHGRALPHSGDS